jgi:hypothetical protein
MPTCSKIAPLAGIVAHSISLRIKSGIVGPPHYPAGGPASP